MATTRGRGWAHRAGVEAALRDPARLAAERGEGVRRRGREAIAARQGVLVRGLLDAAAAVEAARRDAAAALRAPSSELDAAERRRRRLRARGAALRAAFREEGA